MLNKLQLTRDHFVEAIRDWPERILLLLSIRTLVQHPDFNPNKAKFSQYTFHWDATPEGVDVLERLCCGNHFNLFAEQYVQRTFEYHKDLLTAWVNRYFLQKGAIENFPGHVIEAMLDEQVKQGNKRDAEVFQRYAMASTSSGGFMWSDSEQGHPFWEAVIKYHRFGLIPENNVYIHQELMREYTQELMQGEHQPWQHWEFKHYTDSEWQPLKSAPEWSMFYDYRKTPSEPEPSTIKHTACVPLHVYTSAPPWQTEYYVINAHAQGGMYGTVWYNTSSDMFALENGLAFVTEAAAKDAVRAMKLKDIE